MREKYKFINFKFKELVDKLRKEYSFHCGMFFVPWNVFYCSTIEFFCSMECSLLFHDL